MENKGSTSVYAAIKSNLPTFNRKPRGISSHQDRSASASKPATEKEENEFPIKTEGEKKKSDSLTRKRPSTVSGNSRRRSEGEGKNKSGDRGSIGSISTNSKNSKQIKPKSASLSKTPIKLSKVYFPEPTSGSSSLLSIAIEAQQQITATLRFLRDELRKKAEEIQAKLKADSEGTDDSDQPNSTIKPNFYPGPSACFFENSYASCLDEIFQAWINLLYLITNLKITLNRVIEVPGTETFKPDLESEKALITQAMECVKFFSQLKMKSLMEGFEEINVVEDPKMKNFQILDFEERISSSFFSEMDTLSKKAKEMMDHIKKEVPTEVN